MTSELPVKAVRCVTVGAVCIFRRDEGSEAVKPPTTNNSRNPFTLIAVARDTLIAGEVVKLLRTVEAILASGRLSQISNSVISSITIYVVDLLLRPFTVNKQPRNPVGKKYPIKALDFNVSVSAFPTCYFSNLASGNTCSDVWPALPRKNSHIPIIVKASHEQCPRDWLAAVGMMCDAWSNHCDPLMVRGEKPGFALERVPGFAIMPQLALEA